MQTLRVAAVQCNSLNGAPNQNLENAAPHVAAAAARGAQLIVCPEFLATGYLFDESIWDVGESSDGATETWLAAQARTHRVTIGAGYLEAIENDFFNTFSLFGPVGLLGRVRKQALPVFEGRYFKPCPEPKIIDTSIGRIAVGICQDNHTRGFLAEVAQMRPDLVLMPHSAPVPELGATGGRLLAPLFNGQLDTIATRFAAAVGVPVILANKVGHEAFSMPIPWLPRVRVPMRFHGHSQIVDGDGVRRGRLVDAEGVVVADVSLDPTRRRSPRVPRGGYWSFGPGVFAAPVGRVLEWMDAASQVSYRRNPRRAAKARATSPQSDGIARAD